MTKNKKTTEHFAIFQYTRLCLISFLLLHFITFKVFYLFHLNLMNLLVNTGTCILVDYSVSFRQCHSGHAKSLIVRYLNVQY